MTQIDEAVARLSPSEFDAFIDLINDAFGFSPADGFTHLLAGRYKPTPELVGCNCFIRRDGQMVAGAGVFPITWRVGGRELTMAGVGGVAVDPRFRRQGLMRRVMDHVRRRIGEAGYPLSWLGGQRQRYLYWGWERAGWHWTAHVQPANVRHDPPAGYDAIELVPIGDDASLLDAAYELHGRQPVHAVRPRELMGDFLRHWRTQAYAACDGQRRVRGYLSMSVQQRHVVELVVADAGDAGRIVARAVMEHGPLTIMLPAGVEPALLHSLSQVAETMRLGDAGNWQIFDWPAVLEAVMHAAHAARPLVSGEVVAEIEGAGAVRLAMTGDGPVCEPTHARPALSVDAATATRMLFGPLRPSDVVSLPGEAAVLEAWCPLPLSLPRLDHV